MIEQFDRILKIIQRYFTCEGRFNTLYQYHIRLLLHFAGKVKMNIPYYLLRSIGKMSDRIQSKYKDVDARIFHSRLIRMLVSEELGKKDISWNILWLPLNSICIYHQLLNRGRHTKVARWLGQNLWTCIFFIQSPWQERFFKEWDASLSARTCREAIQR